jgi:pimeloyl-ACP methyl ester carboxylesterase
LPPELPHLDGVRHTHLELPGYRAHVAELGDIHGDPIVLLHGWPQHWWCWRRVMPPLAERGYRVIAPDLRGHGWSDAPADGYGKEQFAADLVALLDELGLDRVKLIAHDWGAMAGFLACLRHPDRFDRYVACGIAPPFPSGDPKQLLGLWRMYYQLPLTAPVVARRLVSRADFIRFVIRRGVRAEGAIDDADLDLYAEAMAARPDVTLAIYRTFLLRELPAIARGRWAGRLTVPTRLVLGDHEPVTSPDRVLPGVRRYAADMRVHELPGVGHFTPEEAPGALVERALAFFA